MEYVMLVLRIALYVVDQPQTFTTSLLFVRMKVQDNHLHTNLLFDQEKILNSHLQAFI
jgi:hypothetical protein